MASACGDGVGVKGIVVRAVALVYLGLDLRALYQNLTGRRTALYVVEPIIYPTEIRPACLNLLETTNQILPICIPKF